MSDAISRQAAIDAVIKHLQLDYEYAWGVREAINGLPSAEPGRLTDDDFETIRIHLNAYKEQLCNQHRWEEAEEYQRIIDRFMAFASAEPEIIHCKDCKHWMRAYLDISGKFGCNIMRDYTAPNDYCFKAERKEDG